MESDKLERSVRTLIQALFAAAIMWVGRAGLDLSFIDLEGPSGALTVALFGAITSALTALAAMVTPAKNSVDRVPKVES